MTDAASYKKVTLTYFTGGPLGDLKFTFEDDDTLRSRGIIPNHVNPKLGDLTAKKQLKMWLNSFDLKHHITFSFSAECDDAHTMKEGGSFFWVSFAVVTDGYYLKIANPENNEVLLRHMSETLGDTVGCIFQTFATHFSSG